MNYERQRDIVNQSLISRYPVSLIGCGAIGSAVAMALAKMGVNYFTLYDEDGVNEVNLSNQMYRIGDLGDFKVDALGGIIKGYNPDAVINAINKDYYGQPLTQIVIVATDSMRSRQKVWEQFCVQSQCGYYIEARMGAEEGQIYTFRKVTKSDTALVLIPYISEEDKAFYWERLYSDIEAVPLPCTGKAVIYNVFMIASLVCRAFKATIHNEPFPREVVFGMKQIHKYSFQIRD